MKYPKSVFFIVSNEFCERFSYYGMRTVLPLYMMEMLQYSEVTSTVIFHTFTMLAYFFPLIGAIVADSWLGKYRTILYLSILYAFGQLLLSASSTPLFQLTVRETSLLGLLLIALGTGGIKPCVASFGGEQFELPEQEKYLSKFFSVFYFSINCGSFLSTVITPILRKDVTCFNLNSCYPLAFLVPSILMILSLVIFIAGKRMYKQKEPAGNVVLQVVQCIYHAIRRKIDSSEKREHWLDYADDVYDRKVIDDTKAVLRVLKLFIPLPIFWALFNQQGSRWTFQATRMDGEILGYLIKPDQFHAVNSILIMILLPLFEWRINPIIERFLLINTPLRKLTAGGVLVATAFFISGIVELNLEPTYAVQPSAGLAQVRIFNTLDCPANLSFNGEDYHLESFGMYQNLSIPLTGNKTLSYNLKIRCSSEMPLQSAGNVEVQENKALSYLLERDGLKISFPDAIEKSRTGDPMVRALILSDTESPVNLRVRLDSMKNYELKLRAGNFITNFIEVNHNVYSASIEGIQILENVPLKSGGVYTIVGRIGQNNTVNVKTITVIEPNSMHMCWLLPQFFVITVAEILFSVTGLQFAFTQAPTSMKSFLQAIWLLTMAIGNLLVVIIAKAHFFERQVLEHFLFSGIMCINLIIFVILAMFYKYADNSSDTGYHYEMIELRKQIAEKESYPKLLEGNKSEAE